MKDLLKQIKSLRILVIGDVMLDRYVIGEVNRISPEAPVPVLTVHEEQAVAGGAANVALNIRSLGAQVESIGWFGQDDRGNDLVEILQNKEILVDKEFRFSSTATISKSRVTASNHQICRVDREAKSEHYQPDLAKLGSLISEKVSQADAVIVSDYGKGFVTNELLSLVRKSSKFLAIDPKPSRLLDYSEPDLLTPNRMEALELAGMSRESRGVFPALQVVESIFNIHSPEMLAITLGGEGMLLAKSGNVERTIPTAAREVFDVSGAGDTVIASLTLALTAGQSFEQAAEFANLAAGVVVGKVGTATVSPEEILSL
jgi:rfaE bifunctional protein kinase chain/domain